MRLLARLVGLALVLRGPLADARTGDQWQDLPQTLAHRYGVIGAQVEAAGPDTLRVSRVRQHGPAARAGLRRGDLVPVRVESATAQTLFGRVARGTAQGERKRSTDA